MEWNPDGQGTSNFHYLTIKYCKQCMHSTDIFSKKELDFEKMKLQRLNLKCMANISACFFVIFEMRPF